MAIAADLAHSRSSERRRLLIIVGGAALVELAFGAAIGRGQAALVALPLAFAVLATLTVAFPFAITCAFMVIVASVFTQELPTFSFAGRTIFPYEPLLALLLGLAIVRPRRNTWGGGIGLLLALFLGTLALSSLVAIRYNGAALNDVLLWGRTYFVLAFFWVVIRLFPEREQVRKLLIAAAVIAALTGVVSVLLAVGVNPSLVGLKPNAAALADAEGGLRRTRLPGLAFGFALLWLVLYCAMRGAQPRWLWRLCLLGITAALVVSLNRNMWVTAVAGIAILLIVTGPRVRGRIVSGTVVVGATIALLALLPQTQALTADSLRPIVKRGETLFNPSAVQSEDSLQDRDRENRLGWATAKHHLLLGVAPGVSYGLYILDSSTTPPQQVPQLFLHNQYLYILVITGIPGLLSLVLFMGGSALSAFAWSRGQPESLMLGIGVVALMLTSIVMLSLSDTSYLLAIALITAAIYALRPVDAR